MSLRKLNYDKCGDDYMFWVGLDTGVKAVDLVRIQEYNPMGRALVRYRVDFENRTVQSLLSLVEAKQLARKLLRPYRA